MADSDQKKQLLQDLFDHHDSIHPAQQKLMRRMIREMIALWTGDIQTLLILVNVSSHTIGDQQTLHCRSQLFQALNKETIPWSPDNLNFSGP